MSNPKFDQVVEGNIDIKKLSKKKYQITFNKISKFLKYQIWTKNTLNDNDDRSVYYQNAKLWIQNFNALNESDTPFRPTTVMEIGSKKYLFVLNNTKLNGKGHVVFKVSTEEIELSGKKMLKLPCGHHDSVRFDIDATPLPSSNSIVLGNSLGLASSWPFCFCVNTNTCPQGYPGAFGPLNQQVAGWTSWGYSSTNWTINELGADGSDLNVGSGYLFVYMNSWLCGTNINKDQGPAQLVTLSAISQINALNNPNDSIGGSLSQFILNYLNTHGMTLCQLMPNLINDEPLVKPTPLFFNTNQLNFPYSYLPDAPDGINKCLYILVLTSQESGFLSSTIGVSLTNIRITNIDRSNASFVTDVQNPYGPFIRISDVGSFTFNATQLFYQKISPNKHPHPCPPPPPPLNPRPHPPTQNICYLETQLTITVNITS